MAVGKLEQQSSQPGADGNRWALFKGAVDSQRMLVTGWSVIALGLV